ncbi:transglycosylase SLT domain-containing protein [Psychrobacter sp. I-STPA10]|uniref:transglycosylase SLT domain-containing protein n=1 Tax=Psychrobacter sp. I-STPA10 TaxID=2585769 RepID=UPI001E429F7F|nr:transglycosylase SLT domain-containing protein [Psychrobacter sp. I-STPA10]
MHRFTQYFNHSFSNLRQHTTHKLNRCSQYCSQFFAQSSTNTDKNIISSNKPARFEKTKKVAQISGIALLSLPAKSFIPAQVADTTPRYTQVIASNTLTVAAVAGDSTFFAINGFQHGLGYDLTRSFANTLEVDLALKTYATEAEALQAVQLGLADMALTTASTANIESHTLSSIDLSCGQDKKLTKNGLHPKVNWSFKTTEDPLAVKASHYICQADGKKETSRLANFYNQNLLKDAYNQKHFATALNHKLPNYIDSFKQQAKNYNHDWELLVAMGYQESHLNANATSPTGVQGLMMLTNSTAKAMGVSNRIDPFESIGGGARYLNEMKETFADVPNPDRLWFALASYNMGPNAIKRIQRKLEDRGEDGNSWANVYAYMLENKAHNSRYVQCMHYVKNIRSYLESIKFEEDNIKVV